MNVGSAGSVPVVTGSGTVAETTKPEVKTDVPAVPAPESVDTVTISDEGLARAMADNPGNWPDPPVRN